MSSPLDRTKYLGPNNYVPFLVTSTTDPTSTDVYQPNGSFYACGDQGLTFWFNSTDRQLWFLSGFDNSGSSTTSAWVAITAGGGLTPISSIVTEGGTIVATPGGQITLTGVTTQTATGADKLLTKTPGGGSETTGNIGINPGVAAATTALTNAGAVSFVNTQFAVDANGFTSLVGGAVNPSIQTINVDGATVPGTDPVVSNASGEVTYTASQVAAGTVGANALRAWSTAANQVNHQIQRAAAAPAADVVNNGISSYNSAQFTVDANAFVSMIDRIALGAEGLGITYADSTLSITYQDGTALSATNFGRVFIPSKSAPGVIKAYPVTANRSFIDDTGASNILGALFGLTAGANWANAMPFYIYAICDSTEALTTFGISRIPNLEVTPAAGAIGKIGTPAAATGQNSLFLMENVTVANFATQPCVCIGSFRMTKTSGAADDWTVTALDSQDGIGRFNENRAFDMPLAYFGAAALTHWLANGGTAPVFTNNFYKYYVKKNGKCDLYYTADTNTTPGVGAVEAQLSVPFNQQDGLAPFGYNGSGNIQVGATDAFIINWRVNSSGNIGGGWYANHASSGQLQNEDITITTNLSATYQILSV